VDAREALRRYLEQRREMGESELVLDSLSVEETLRLLGAAGGAPTEAASTSGVESEERAAISRVVAATGDWRETLRAAGATPDASKKALVREAAEPAAAPVPSVDAPIGISVGGAGRELFGGDLESLDSIEAIATHVASCTRCPLYSTATNHVPGEGSAQADFMCVGEAPGANEDETGRPFIGAAGQLLTKILDAIQLRREDVYICNVLKHRPPGNRNPRPEEVAACSPYLIRQIELIRPKVILALGTFAAQTLLDTKLSIGKLRGQVHRYYGVPLIVTYHPAALLRNPGWKRPTWEDVQLARRILDSAAKSGA